ncbi:tetratricopeptide repeat protein [Aurantibacillus circumpalustris]|uniref:tetratricopeptide repeat protein n=1 Tax=Aurantibacillus circumpalustris TaxID=3036359 RepID=UPI0037BFBBAC
MGDYEASLKMFQAAIKISPKESRGYLGVAKSYYNLKDYTKCLESCDKALKSKPILVNRYVLYYYKGNCYYYLEDWNSAVKFYTLYINGFSTSYDLYSYRGFSFFKLGKYNEAIEDFQYFLKNPQITNNESADAYSFVGHSYYMLNDKINALKFGNLAFYYDSTNTNGLILLGDILYGEKKFPEALLYFQKTLQYDSTNTYFIIKTTSTLFEMKQIQKAIDGLKRLLLQKPNTVLALNNIAYFLFIDKKYKEALPYANKNIELNDNNSNAYGTRGCVHYGLLEYEKAIADFTQSIQLNKNNPHSYYYRSLCHLKLINIKAACSDLKKMQEYSDFEIPEGEASIQELLRINCKE